MLNSNFSYPDNIKGEISIIHNDIVNFKQENLPPVLSIDAFLANQNMHLESIERKVGVNSSSYINISTEIVDSIIDRVRIYTNSNSVNDAISRMSPSDIVEFYSNQRKNLEKAISIMRQLSLMNMDYAYRHNQFNNVQKDIELQCKNNGIDIRTTTQKSVDNLKKAGEVSAIVAKESAGCALALAIKIGIVILFFLILMTIMGVKK